MYQTPKAIHFLVKKNGKEINTHEALSLKWAAAETIAAENIDFCHLSDDDFEFVASVLNTVNGKLKGLTIELRNDWGA